LPDQLEARENAAQKVKKAELSDFGDAVEDIKAAEKRRLERAELKRRRELEEKERLELARQEEMRLALEQEQKKLAEQLEQDKKDLESIFVVINNFKADLPQQQQLRHDYISKLNAEREQFEESRRLRRKNNGPFKRNA